MNNEPSQNHPQAISIMSLISGIVALLCGIMSILSIPLGITAIVLGIIGINKCGGKGMAITGIITGAIGLIAGIAVPALVFLAIPSLQRNQSDIAAKNDASSAAAGVSSYMAANHGALPSEDVFNSTNFNNKYLSEVTTNLTYTLGVNCSGATGQRLYSISTALGNGKDYCVD